MATIGNTYVSLADVLKGTDADGKRAATVIELLSERNDILQDAPVMQGNKDTGELITIRDSLPTVSWYKLYAGVTPTKGTTKQVMETCGIMKAMSVIDSELLKISPDPKGYRMQQDRGFLESMNQEMTETLFYGNVNTAPEEFHGIATRYNDGNGADVSDQIIDGGAAGGQTDNTSVYLMGWAEDKVHLIYPKNTKGGIEFQDRGEQLITNSDGTRYFAAVSEYTWRPGLAIKDRRFVARIANLDVSAMATYGTGSDTSPKLDNLMIDAIERINNIAACRPVFYAPRKVWTLLWKMQKDKANVNLTWAEIGGRPVLHFAGIPIRICDGISYAESQVSFA